jgi:hypothetical protein
MRAKVRPLLCELHAHTTWSDGALSVPELVDLYGRHGFDVLCVTDHILGETDPWRRARERDGGSPGLTEKTWRGYLRQLDQEARRARVRYGLLVIPGAELTLNDDDADRAAHAVAVGLRRFVPVEAEFAGSLHQARAAGAGLVAAHPHGGGDPDPDRTTRRWWRERETLVRLVDRFELFNRNVLYGWVAEAGLPAVASGDFHRLEHLMTWKTLLPCAKNERSIVAYLRSPRPAYLTRLEDHSGTSARAA